VCIQVPCVCLLSAASTVIANTPDCSDRQPGVYEGVHRSPPELLPRLEGEEVRGLTSVAVPIDGTSTASVKPVMAPPVPGMQKPPRREGKQFQDCLEAAPERKVKIPAGLKTRPAWLRQGRLGAKPAVCCGDAGCQAQRLWPYRA
jgi:hypothetical protein